MVRLGRDHPNSGVPVRVVVSRVSRDGRSAMRPTGGGQLDRLIGRPRGARRPRRGRRRGRRGARSRRGVRRGGQRRNLTAILQAGFRRGSGVPHRAMPPRPRTSPSIIRPTSCPTVGAACSAKWAKSTPSAAAATIAPARLERDSRSSSVRNAFSPLPRPAASCGSPNSRSTVPGSARKRRRSSGSPSIRSISSALRSCTVEVVVCSLTAASPPAPSRSG